VKRIVTGERVAPWVAKKLFARMSADAAIGLERDGEMIAGVVYENWNGASFVCHIAVEGLMTPAYLGAIFHYPFVHCGATKIFAPVAESNAECVKFVKNLGFRLEHRLLDAHPDGSILLYSMKPDQCRFIGEKYGQEFTSSAAAA
jgi:hypothetical protein